MRIAESGQITENFLLDEDLTILVCADGYEARSTAAASRLKHKPVQARYALPFNDQKMLYRVANDAFFEEQSYTVLPELSGSDFDGAYAAFEEILHDHLNGNVCRLAIDYSCMTRAWLGAFVSCLFARKAGSAPLDVFFLYSPAAFSDPQYPSPNATVAPLRGFSSLRAVDEPIALVIGCGYEKMRASGLKEYIDPAKTILFYTDPAFDERYPKLVAENNASLFKDVGDQNILRYPLHDMDSTAALLYDVIADLSKQFRVVLAPLGVKPFSLLSMLIAGRYGTADVWRVSGETFASPAHGKPSGQFLVYRVTFEGEGTAGAA